jgi:hypothetical protein
MTRRSEKDYIKAAVNLSIVVTSIGTDRWRGPPMSYPIFIPKPCTHYIHDPGSIVPHIWPKVSTDIQMS